MKAILNILACILIFGGGMVTDYYLVRRYCYRPIVKLVPVQAPIPSAREIQQRLTDLGKPRYDPNGVDGWIGTDSRTAWDNYTCDQFAKRAIEGK